MLVLHVPHALQYTSPDSVTQVLRGRLWVNVPQVHRSIKSLHSCASSHAHAIRWKCGVRGEWTTKWVRRSILHSRVRREGCRMDEGLRSSSLGSLSSGLLWFGDVGASILAVVDALTCPRWFRRQRIDHLRNRNEPLVKLIKKSRIYTAHTLVATEMLKKCTNPIFLSLTILTWSIKPNLLSSSLNISSVIPSSSPPR